MNKLLTLQHKYYAGSQTWFSIRKKYRQDYWLRRYGCGVVAMADFCIYKGLIEQPKDRQEYLQTVRMMSKKWMHVLPGFGISIYFFAFYANLYYRIKRIPYRFKRVWVFGRFRKRKQKMAEKISGQLEKDLPLVFAAGPKLPFVGKTKKPYLYRLVQGQMVRTATTISGHYMTITGLYRDGDEDYLQLASWGDIWYMSLSEYMKFAKYTIPFSNAVFQTKINYSGGRA